jgi:nitrate/nitrite transporter NarK
MLIQLIFAIVIARAFYQLADENKKNRAGYAILGFVLFHVSFWVYFILMAIIVDIDRLEYISSDLSYFIVSIMPYISGLVVSVVLYIRFDKKWKKVKEHSELDDLGKKH